MPRRAPPARSARTLAARLSALEERVARIESRRPPPGDGRTASRYSTEKRGVDRSVARRVTRCAGCGLPLRRKKGRCAECGRPLDD